MLNMANFHSVSVICLCCGLGGYFLLVLGFVLGFLISSNNGIGIISFSAVFQKSVKRKSLHFIAKRKKKVFWKGEGKNWWSCFLSEECLWWKENRKTMYAWIPLKFISGHYLYCLHTIKTRMDGRGMIKLVGDSWDMQNSGGSPSRLCWQFQRSLKDNEMHKIVSETF